MIYRVGLWSVWGRINLIRFESFSVLEIGVKLNQQEAQNTWKIALLTSSWCSNLINTMNSAKDSNLFTWAWVRTIGCRSTSVSYIQFNSSGQCELRICDQFFMYVSNKFHVRFLLWLSIPITKSRHVHKVWCPKGKGTCDLENFSI